MAGCQKIPFATQAAARQAANAINRKKFRGYRGPFMRAYQCPECSGTDAVWHTTRKPQPARKPPRRKRK
jgi:hypothetical protein